MAPMNNSCEYEPWQNPAEGPWKTLTAASRQFLLRGFGDDNPDSQAYWPYSHQQAADVENAIMGIGRISRLRTPILSGICEDTSVFPRWQTRTAGRGVHALGLLAHQARMPPRGTRGTTKGPRDHDLPGEIPGGRLPDARPSPYSAGAQHAVVRHRPGRGGRASPVRITSMLPSRTRSPTIPMRAMSNLTATPSPRTCRLRTPRDQGPAVTLHSRTGGRCTGKTTSTSTRARSS